MSHHENFSVNIAKDIGFSQVHIGEWRAKPTLILRVSARSVRNKVFRELGLVRQLFVPLADYSVIDTGSFADLAERRSRMTRLIGGRFSHFLAVMNSVSRHRLY